MALLVVKNLKKVFIQGWWPFTRQERFVAVDAISFSLHEGEILGLLGANGAGKTTTTHMLLDILTPTSGSIAYFGKELRKHRSEILQHVAFASTYIKLPGQLTVWENLDIYGRLYSVPHALRLERIKMMLKEFDIWHLRDKSTSILSAGQTAHVMLAKAFVSDPRLVILDEPTAALDPEVAYTVRNFIIKQKNERGIGVLFTSHNMDEVTQICDRALMMANGVIIADDTPQRLAASVSTAAIHLDGVSGMPALMDIMRVKNLSYVIREGAIDIAIDEHAVAAFLFVLAQQGILYDHISIEKPSLEDYFLNVTRTMSRVR